jgi:MFS family permease
MSEVTSYMGLRGPALSSVIGATAGLAFFLFGYDQGDLAGLLTVPSFRRQFPQADTIGFPDSAHVANLQGLTIGIWNLGCFFSAILTILIGDKIGRKKTMLMGLTFLAIGEIIQASSFSWSQFLVGRAVAGFGNGFNTATVPAWQAECTKVHRRGTLLMVTAGTFIAAGLSFSYWMDFAFAWLEPSSAAWRIPIAIQLIFLLIAALLLLLMPESPRWLILTGREQEALKVLSALNDKAIDSHDVRQVRDPLKYPAKSCNLLTHHPGIFADQRRCHRNVKRQLWIRLHHGRLPTRAQDLLGCSAAGLPANDWYQPHHAIPGPHVRPIVRILRLGWSSPRRYSRYSVHSGFGDSGRWY